MNPTPETIKRSRLIFNLSVSEAAFLVGVHRNTWAQWEKGSRRMHPAFWELFLIKTRKNGL